MMNTLRWIVCITAVFILNIPILATLVTSLKSAKELSINPSLWINAPTFENYLKILTMTDRANIFAYLINSFCAASIGSVLAVVLSFPAAYAVARGGFGRKTLLPLVVNLRAVPLIIFAIPLYVMFQWLGLLDTRLGLGLILTIVNIPLALVILANAIADIPEELDKAAKIDGASTLQIMLGLIGPVARPAIATTLIFGFVTAWNEFLFGLLITTKQAVPVTVGASFFFSSSGGGVQWGVASAVMVLAALPPMLLGLLMYRQIAGSMTAGAVKG